jgi:hypothetical protein
MTSARTHELTDAEFVTVLRQRTDSYLKAVDAWEAAYGKYYRVISPGQVSSDMRPVQENFQRARDDLKELLPRVHRLCLKHDVKNAWQLIIRVDLSANPPQTRTASAIGRGERNVVNQCIATLEAATQVDFDVPDEPLPPAAPQPEKSKRHRGILGRIYDYFF